MRILFLTNLYPPFSLGGYEQWCQEVANELKIRGHIVHVITSQKPGDVKKTELNGVTVLRILHQEVESGLINTVFRLLISRKKLEAQDLKWVDEYVSEYQPDIAVIWGMWNIPRAVPALVEKLLPGRVVYYLCDYWLTLPNAYIQRWQETSRHSIAGLPKRILAKLFLPILSKEKPAPLKLEHPVCVSNALKGLLIQAGISVQHAQVIYGGVKTEEFRPLRRILDKTSDSKLRLVYFGRLVPDKGVHTAIKALGVIADKSNVSVVLDIIGKGNQEYVSQLVSMVNLHHLENIVSFQGNFPRHQIPGMLINYDALLFTSEWEEPFARTVLEAMAAGLVVIGTTTGGTKEILTNGVTGLTFPAGNFQGLADQICLLYQVKSLLPLLADNGRSEVINKFTFSHMVDEIEQKLRGIIIFR